MTALAPILEAFFTDPLMTQRGASPHTIASYRDTFTLLLGYLHQQTGKLPAQLDLADLDPATIGAFLLAAGVRAGAESGRTGLVEPETVTSQPGQAGHRPADRAGQDPAPEDAVPARPPRRLPGQA